MVGVGMAVGGCMAVEARRQFKPGVSSGQASVEGEMFIGLLSLFI